jgi:6-pyruvoyltetrahydropterin/6-carboxytetrahydropterin synthase
MPLLTLTRRVHFSAAHRYRRPEWDDARNLDTFGKCARPNYHGHTYICDVTVTGPVDAQTGFVVDLGLLDRVLRDDIVERLDHANLNLEIPEFAEGNTIPSSEMLCAWIAERVASGLAHTASRVVRVQVAEEPNLWATWSTAEHTP